MAHPDASHCRRGGRPHKGDRVLLIPVVPYSVWGEIHQEAAASGLPDSQYVANLLAEYVGRPDLVSNTREKLPARAAVKPVKRVPVGTRPPREVFTELQREAAAAGSLVGPYVAEVLTAIYSGGMPGIRLAQTPVQEALLAV